MFINYGWKIVYENHNYIDIDEFDEKSFDELGERYLKKVYENVNSFKCTNVSSKKDKLIVEGKVNFASGKVSPTLKIIWPITI